MDGYWVLAICEGQYIYAMHNKIYVNRKQAERALETFKKSGKAHSSYKVYQLSGLKEAPDA